ncbi:hypothetical protein [Haloferula sp. BvORR071]|nr:hypothetical protein [Haloferula sp. BvORR071]
MSRSIVYRFEVVFLDPRGCTTHAYEIEHDSAAKSAIDNSPN